MPHWHSVYNTRTCWFVSLMSRKGSHLGNSLLLLGAAVSNTIKPAALFTRLQRCLRCGLHVHVSNISKRSFRFGTCTCEHLKMREWLSDTHTKYIQDYVIIHVYECRGLYVPEPSGAHESHQFCWTHRWQTISHRCRRWRRKCSKRSAPHWIHRCNNRKTGTFGWSIKSHHSIASLTRFSPLIFFEENQRSPYCFESWTSNQNLKI